MEGGGEMKVFQEMDVRDEKDVKGVFEGTWDPNVKMLITRLAAE